jgi:hypothetical protein
MSDIHTGHVWYERAVLRKNRFNSQNSIKSTQNDLKLCREDYHRVGRLLLEYHHPIQTPSPWNKENPSKNEFFSQKIESYRSMNSWGFRQIYFVKRVNSRPSSSSNNRFDPKHPKTQDPSKNVRGEGREKRTRRTTKLQKRNLWI